VRVELAGLVDDLLRDRDLADVVQQAACSRRGLDDVAQHQSGAAVGATELEHPLQAPAALVAEQRQQPGDCIGPQLVRSNAARLIAAAIAR
jgi:hypothetical protein